MTAEILVTMYVLAHFTSLIPRSSSGETLSDSESMSGIF
jgi:hypothetical protein